MRRLTKALDITEGKKENRVGRWLLVPLLCAATSACSDHIRGTVKQQLTRPGGRVTAILAEDYGKDVYYEVYLKSEKDGSVERVFSAFDMDAPPEIRWQNPDALVVRMTCAEIVRYHNDYGYWWNDRFNFIFIGLEGNTRLCAHAGDPTPGL